MVDNLTSLTRRGVCLSLCLSAVAAAVGQTRDLAILEGEVRDAAGLAVAGATVTVEQNGLGLIRQTRTNASGHYRFAGLPVSGQYVVRAESKRFRPADSPAIELRANSVAHVDLALNVAGMQAEVTVLGTAGTVQTGTDEVGTRLGLAKIENTSIANNRVSSLTLLDSAVRPATTTGDLFTNETLFVVNGGGRRQTTWAIDNQNANESWGRQTLFTSLPMVAIQEFEILSDAVPAEYGWTSGSAVNIVTRSGSNQWHGDLLGTGRPAFSQASAPLALVKATNTLAQGSGSISGPLLHGKTWFNLAGEYSSQTRAAVITSPLAFGTFFDGHFDQTLFLGRLDHQWNGNNRTTLRASGDRFTDTNPADAVSGTTLPTAARTFERDTYGINLTHTTTLGANTVNEARAQFQLASPVTRFAPVIYGAQLFATGYYSYGDSRSANLMNHQFEFANTLSHQTGRHTLKLGFDFIHSSSGGYGQEFGSGYVRGRYQVNVRYAALPIDQVIPLNPGAIPAGQPSGSPTLVSSYTQAFGNQSYNVTEWLSAGFFQDDWKLTENLTFNLGVRYEQQTFVADNNNVAPRIGLAWRVPSSHSMSIRGGYGVFFSEIRANQAASYALGDPRGVFSFTASPGQCGFPTSFTPWASLSALLASPGCVSGASQAIPQRSITVPLGQNAYLNQFFNGTALRFYPSRLLNPYTQQWNLGGDLDLGRGWLLSLDYVGTRGLKIERIVELNAPTSFVRTSPGQTRSVAAANATRPVQPTSACTLNSGSFNPAISNCFNNYSSIQTLANNADAYYQGLNLKVQHQLSSRLSALLTYTYSHAINTYEQDASGGSPNDWNSLTENERGRSPLDQRHRAALSGWYQLPFRFDLGAVAQLASGFPFNPITGFDNNGDGSSTDRPIVNGRLLGRNTGQGSSIYIFDTSLQKTIAVKERLQVSLRAEAFNVLNHANYFGRNTAYGDGLSPSAVYGAPIGGLANTGAARQMQFLMRLRF